MITGKWHWTLGTKFVSSDRVLRQAFRWYLLFTSWWWLSWWPWWWQWGRWWWRWLWRWWCRWWGRWYWWYWVEPSSDISWLRVWWCFPLSIDFSPFHLILPENLWQVNSEQFSTPPLIFFTWSSPASHRFITSPDFPGELRAGGTRQFPPSYDKPQSWSTSHAGRVQVISFAFVCWHVSYVSYMYVWHIYVSYMCFIYVWHICVLD